LADQPRIPEESIRAAVDGIDKLDFIDGGGQGDAWRMRRNGGDDEFLKVVVQAEAARVAQEIGTMQAVDSPNVMGFTEDGKLEHDGAVYPFIVGEYVDGQSIGARLDAGEWPDESQALAAVAGSLRGLAALHEVDYVHRDYKPSNVALRDNDWDRPVLLDMGLVRDLLGDTITVYPAVLGTVPFMASEQLRREPAVRRSDVFAAGVTLYFLLTREHPFLDQGEPAVAIEVLEERINDSDWLRWNEVSVKDDVREVLKPMLRPNAYQRPRAAPAAEVIQSILEAR